jgi:ADP-ribose pyrophosphatase YjhB (NUDIX family)
MILRHAMAFSGLHGACRPVGRHLARRVTTDSSNNAPSSSSFLPIIFPRAAVSVCVRCRRGGDHYYLLVQRGKAPNLGMWSFPGGKLEYGETTLDGARRELFEETTGWPDNNTAGLEWHDRTFDTTDSIGEGFHYVIAHCYAELVLLRENDDDDANDPLLPVVAPADDAADVRWFRKDAIRAMEDSQIATTGSCRVIERAEALHRANLLETTMADKHT